jgi:hypothetical protein
MKLCQPLICFPCPHNGACCEFGVDITDEEADQMISIHGSESVILDDGGYRTNVKNGCCFFFLDGLCSIHSKSYYPKVCKSFPFEDGILGGPYQGDANECPEFANKRSGI